MKKKKSEKHPKDMTTEEAANHLFHPKLVEHLKKQTKKEGKSK
jgi:hypothetical protein